MADEERNLPASPRKRRKTREEGRVAKSAELVGCVLLLTILTAIPHLAPGAAAQVSDYCIRMVAAAGKRDMGPDTLLGLAGSCFMQAGLIAGPALGMILVGALASNIVQVGFFVNPKQVHAKWDRLNPLQGLQRFFKPQALADLLKGALKISIVGFVGWKFLSGHWDRLFQLGFSPPEQAAPQIGMMAHQMALQMVATLSVLAAADYAYQRWNFERSIKMTRQEVKDELKEMEGNIEMKGKIRRKMREMARRRMMAAVPRAAVVITNPTHFAVALEYQPGQKGAPKLVAKGQDLVAQRIRELAAEHSVPIIENPPLARALFRAVDLGEEIPGELYRAVAEVLALVWKLDRTRGAAR